ncbi:MAG: FAD binding domain-containing protein [Rhizobiales bacterium]|nr:FAD binding domain-containing protein [Hyphomicrobiales bacterium]
MIPGAFAYHRPKSVSEAVAILAEQGDDARPLAGGHSLIPVMKLRLAAPSHLVDLGGIADLKGIRADGSEIVIGAMTTQHALIGSDLLSAKVPILKEAALLIADPQVRYVGTLGGNAANGDPGNDMPAGRVPARDFYEGVYTTALVPGEVLTAVRIPVPADGHGYAYEKLKRKVGDYATAAAAVVLTMSGGKVATCAIGVSTMTCVAMPPERWPAIAILAALHLGVGPADVPDHDRHHGDHDDDRDRRAAAEVAAAAEHPVEHEVGEDLGVPLAVGHGQHDVEHLEDGDGDGRPHHRDGPPDLRDHDVEEQLRPLGAVDDRRLDGLVRNAAEGRREDDHGEAGLDPDQDHHQEEVVPERDGDPRLRLEAEALDDGVEEADLRRALAAVVVDELPDDAGADEGDRHRHEDQRLGDVAPPDAVGEEGDDEAEEGRQRRHHDEPQEVVEDRLAELVVVHRPDVVADADEGLAGAVEE